MNVINKIYMQVLVQLLQRENLICSFIWLFQPALSAVEMIGELSLEVREDLANKHQLYRTTTNYEPDCAALEPIAIVTS
ncbi:hypothetical protein I8748_03450 [Nostoc sp. CENA67]|uniref:Uncharacterized protein n=1 Tax=Amazonocrinis nigriterrae CENA67 TaxID=2794033 RepID=A0A8J7HMN2_9NOST|nr:hypothetical protein [Amazonocrinis nigriterrae]MBH8561240.1 hypothetical protein [Amazonocrinis nigriterrae CENA67]